MTYKTSKPKNRFPVYITGEPLNLTLYRERCRGDVRFALTYYDSTGARQRRTFGTLDEADAEAAKLKEEIRQGGWDLTISDKLPPDEKYNLTSQLLRSALSISNNIAEGSGAGTVKSFKSFLDISIASALETVNLLFFAVKRRYITDTEQVEAYRKAETLSKRFVLSKVA